MPRRQIDQGTSWVRFGRLDTVSGAAARKKSYSGNKTASPAVFGVL